MKHNGGWQHVGPHGVERRQQPVPLDDHPQPGHRRDLRRAVQGQPDEHGGRPRPGRRQREPARPRRRRSRSRCATRARPAPTPSSAQYQVVSPANIANADWVNFPGPTRVTCSDGLQLNPAGGARRDAEGSRIGIISAGNFPGGGTFPGDTPADVKVDYVRITPDRRPAARRRTSSPPATTATLDPAPPGPGGTYDQDVTVDFTRPTTRRVRLRRRLHRVQRRRRRLAAGRLGRRDRGRRAHRPLPLHGQRRQPRGRQGGRRSRSTSPTW